MAGVPEPSALVAMQVHFLRALSVCLSVAFFATQVQGGPEVELSPALLKLFNPDRVHDALSCEVRRPASADGVKEDALFEHPMAPGHPARVDYDLDLPPASEATPLLLAFDIALSDGVNPGKGKDGGRFRVEADGQELFARE